MTQLWAWIRLQFVIVPLQLNSLLVTNWMRILEAIKLWTVHGKNRAYLRWHFWIFWFFFRIFSGRNIERIDQRLTGSFKLYEALDVTEMRPHALHSSISSQLGPPDVLHHVWPPSGRYVEWPFRIKQMPCWELILLWFVDLFQGRTVTAIVNYARGFSLSP